jgi:hypothetical protein
MEVLAQYTSLTCLDLVGCTNKVTDEGVQKELALMDFVRIGSISLDCRQLMVLPW